MTWSFLTTALATATAVSDRALRTASAIACIKYACNATITARRTFARKHAYTISYSQSTALNLARHKLSNERVMRKHYSRHRKRRTARVAAA